MWEDCLILPVGVWNRKLENPQNPYLIWVPNPNLFVLSLWIIFLPQYLKESSMASFLYTVLLQYILLFHKLRGETLNCRYATPSSIKYMWNSSIPVKLKSYICLRVCMPPSILELVETPNEEKSDEGFQWHLVYLPHCDALHLIMLFGSCPRLQGYQPHQHGSSILWS